MPKKTYIDEDLSTPEHDAIMLWLDENAADIFKLDRVETTWEQPAYFTTGIREGHSQGGGRNISRTTSARFIDLLVYGVSRQKYLEAYACEVKPRIKSIGELIRQLRQYEGQRFGTRKDHDNTEELITPDGGLSNYGRPITAKVAVVSPDDRFRDIIERQGFIFIKAPMQTGKRVPDLFD